MNGREFLKRVERWAALRGLTVVFDRSHGKGSHGRLFVGARFTTVKDLKREIGKGLLRSMAKDLGIDPKDLR